MRRKKTTEEFIMEATKKYNGKYDYSKAEYKGADKKVCIICPEHGEFWMTPGNHLFNQGCPKCGKEQMSKNRRLTQDQFIQKAREIHGDKYDYSKVEYIDSEHKICIICPIHGEFWQTAENHIYGKSGCPLCGGNLKSNTNQFIQKAKEIHGDKYDYSKVEYRNANEKVCIICPEHGEFWMTPSSHINRKSGCPKCVGKHRNVYRRV